MTQFVAHGDSSLEDNGLMSRSFAVRKVANGLGALVLVGHEEIIQAFMAKRFKEPFATRKKPR